MGDQTPCWRSLLCMLLGVACEQVSRTVVCDCVPYTKRSFSNSVQSRPSGGCQKGHKARSAPRIAKGLRQLSQGRRHNSLRLPSRTQVFSIGGTVAWLHSSMSTVSRDAWSLPYFSWRCRLAPFKPFGSVSSSASSACYRRTLWCVCLAQSCC